MEGILISENKVTVFTGPICKNSKIFKKIEMRVGVMTTSLVFNELETAKFLEINICKTVLV